MVYYQEDPNSTLPQNWEDYHKKYGNKPGQPGWENLSNPERQWIKENRSPYQSYTPAEEELMGDIYGKIKGGSPTDVGGLEDLISGNRMSPGIRDYLTKRVGKLLSSSTSYEDVYAAQKGKLDTALKGTVRGINETQAAQGLLDSSSTQARIGGAEGGYSGALADLLMGTRAAEEDTRRAKFGQGLNLAGFGLDWAGRDISNKFGLEELRNRMYLQDIGLNEAALKFLSGERANENAFNQGAVRPWDPMTGGEFIPGLIQAGLAAYMATQTGGASLLASEDPFGGGSSGGGGGSSGF